MNNPAITVGRSLTTCLMVLMIAGLQTAGQGQSRSAPTPSFEVASVRVRPPGAPISIVGGNPSGALLTLEARGLSDLVSWAYDVRPWRVIGGPSWSGTQSERDPRLDTSVRRFDVSAKAEGSQPRPIAEFRVMLQDVLLRRFDLSIHREPRETSVYELVINRDGPKLAPSESETNGLMIMKGNGILSATGTTLAQLSEWFSFAIGVDRPVLDRTGLAGRYDFTLEWADMRLTPASTTSDKTGPSIFTALNEQLGLRLEPRRSPVEFIVIDHAVMPSDQ